MASGSSWLSSSLFRTVLEEEMALEATKMSPLPRDRVALLVCCPQSQEVLWSDGDEFLPSLEAGPRGWQHDAKQLLKKAKGDDN